MAQLTTPWSSRQTRSQFAAIVWLRWRITLNTFRRKGGAGELAGRTFLYLLFASVTLFLVAGAGFAAFQLASGGHLPRIAWLLWAIFLLCQFLNIQLGQPGTAFDPTQLIRFPLGLRTYTAVRLFVGLLSPSNIVGALLSLAIAIGTALALPPLWFYAPAALAVFAAANLLFTRMVFAWVDRWLSTRRAREVFTGLIFALSLAIQWANLNFNVFYNGASGHPRSRLSPQQLRPLAGLYHRAHPLLAVLPPELTAAALRAAHRHSPFNFLANILGCSLFAALFLAIFTLRMGAEFRGELLSNAAAGPSAPTLGHASAHPAHTLNHAPSATLGLPPVLPALLGKELLYLRRHMGILYGLLMPIVLVLFFAGRFASATHSLWVFPAAVGYTLLAIAPLSYNAFGFEATGAQLYFLAPLRMSDVLLAKNLFSFLMASVEILAVFAIITYISGLPSLRTAAAAVLWASGTLAINAIFGNRRSFTAPKKINPLRMANKQTSQLSTLISLGVLLLSSTLAAALFILCDHLQAPWLLVPASAVFAAAGILLYTRALRSLDSFALAHREPLFAELCRPT